MCGIVGVYTRESGRVPTRTELRAMLAPILYRGPDGQGFHREPGVGLGFCRLAVIDVKHGMQPIPNETGETWLVCNGEIYNYKILRHILQQRGHAFRTDTDSEVILHAYEEWGEETPEKLRGIFAFAIWDRPRQRLFLGRDRSGVKPLYILRHRGELRFASEIKSLLANGDVPCRLNLFGCFHRSDPDPRLEHTCIEPVAQLAPGCSLCVSRSGERLRRYWEYAPSDADEPEGGLTEEKIIRAFRHELLRVVAMQIMSEVPVGAYLSGGVDSASVVAAMGRAGLLRVRTYTTVFDDRESADPEFSRLAARHLGARARFVRCPSGPRALEAVPFVAWAAEGEFDLGFVSRLFLSQAARQDGVKVILTGQGIDEILAGYHPSYTLFRRDITRTALDRKAGFSLPVPLGTLLEFKALRAQVAESEAQLATARLRQEHSGLSAYLLRCEDRMGMASGVEVRVPMLDHQLIELCGSIPHRLRSRLLSGKFLLRQAVRRWLPEALVWRPKFAFNSGSLPVTHLLARAGPSAGQRESDEAAYLRSLLTRRALRAKGYFNPRAVQPYMDANDFRVLDGVLTVQLLDDLFVRREGFKRFAGTAPRGPVEEIEVERIRLNHVRNRRVRPVAKTHVPRFRTSVINLQCTYPVDPQSGHVRDPKEVLVRYSTTGHAPACFSGSPTTWRFLRLVDGQRTYADIHEAMGGAVDLKSLLSFGAQLTRYGILEPLPE